MNKQQLCEELAAEVREIILEAEKLRNLTEIQFNKGRKDGGWSVGQVLVHLNFYSDYYLPLLEKISASGNADSGHYKPGWLGNYFTKLMAPDAKGSFQKKMKSPAKANPEQAAYPKSVLDTFIADQLRLIKVLKDGAHLNLAEKLPISISKLIRLRSGDVLRFVVAHERRHFIQIRSLLKELSANT